MKIHKHLHKNSNSFVLICVIPISSQVFPASRNLLLEKKAALIWSQSEKKSENGFLGGLLILKSNPEADWDTSGGMSSEYHSALSPCCK